MMSQSHLATCRAKRAISIGQTQSASTGDDLRREQPDYAYLKEVFRQLRTELGIVVPRTPKRLPYVPSEKEVRRYYETVWKTRKPGMWCSSRHCSTPASV